jgi:hypothetical protein
LNFKKPREAFCPVLASLGTLFVGLAFGLGLGFDFASGGGATSFARAAECSSQILAILF